jgi:hypothetical protein
VGLAPNIDKSIIVIGLNGMYQPLIGESVNFLELFLNSIDFKI